MKATSVRINLTLASALLLLLAAVAAIADQPTVRAVLQSAQDRNQAPDFALKDAAGRTVTLRDYQAKVVLLNFWATWCGGCKEELPAFSELRTKYRDKGLEVVGVAMDDDGWKAIKPFLAATKVSYTILAGDDGTFRSYGLQDLPDTFLIDREGRIAAVYTMGLVDENDVEANIKALLSKP